MVNRIDLLILSHMIPKQTSMTYVLHPKFPLPTWLCPVIYCNCLYRPNLSVPHFYTNNTTPPVCSPFDFDSKACYPPFKIGDVNNRKSYCALLTCPPYVQMGSFNGEALEDTVALIDDDRVYEELPQDPFVHDMKFLFKSILWVVVCFRHPLGIEVLWNTFQLLNKWIPELVIIWSAIIYFSMAACNMKCLKYVIVQFWCHFISSGMKQYNSIKSGLDCWYTNYLIKDVVNLEMHWSSYESWKKSASLIFRNEKSASTYMRICIVWFDIYIYVLCDFSFILTRRVRTEPKRQDGDKFD